MSLQINIKKKLYNFQLNIKIDTNSRRIGILGASGCGKSMTLKCIAGIETPDQGEIIVDGNVLFCREGKHSHVNRRPQKRSIGYLFQNYALFPTMSVEQNIAAGLTGDKSKIQKRVQEMIHRFRLEGLEKQLPGELSGGQQQRVALARIMAYEPEVILLDEPFSALDGFLKDRLQQEMIQSFQDYPGIVILVSHSRDEIYRFSEELVIVEDGQVVCEGPTEEIFENPRFAAAARVTGCKNLTEAKRVDAHHLNVPAWGTTFKLRKEIPEEIQMVGVRAHDFIPVWDPLADEHCMDVQGSREEYNDEREFFYKRNHFKEAKEICKSRTVSIDQAECYAGIIHVSLASIAKLPFERKYFLKTESKEELCWFVQRDLYEELDKRGLPTYLAVPEEKLLLLKRESK